VGGACGTHGRGEKSVQGLVGKPEGKERDHLDDRGIDGGLGLKWILARLAGGVDSPGSG
jgi:hypothetical protein